MFDSEMFSVVKFANKKIESKTETVPDIWLIKEKKETYVLSPWFKEENELELQKAIKEKEKPKPNWHKFLSVRGNALYLTSPESKNVTHRLYI